MRGRLSEHHEQALLIQEVRIRMVRKYPELWGLYAIPNQGGSGLNGIRRGMQMKAEGGKRGVYDLCLPVPRIRQEPVFPHPSHCPYFMGLYIEMKEAPRVSRVRKSISYSKPDPEQILFGDFVRSNGYVAECANGMDEAVEVLLWYLNLTPIDPIALRVDYSHVDTIR